LDEWEAVNEESDIVPVVPFVTSCFHLLSHLKRFLPAIL
jgi:hypothetical protein